MHPPPMALLLLLLLWACCYCYNVEAFGPSRSQNWGCRQMTRMNAGAFVVEITTAEEFEKVTTGAAASSDELVVIDYAKSNCKPCMRTAPEFEKLALKFNTKASFFKIDGDRSVASLAILKNNGIRSVPTFHVWRGGKRIDSVQGAHVDELETIVQSEVNLIEQKKAALG